MVRKKILLSLVCLGLGQLHAQEDFSSYKGILRFDGTFAGGYNLAFKSVNYFLQGDLEYYVDDRWSVRSDIYYFLNSRTNDPVEPFKFQHSLFTGFEYHITKGRLDWYAGFQPGLVYAQRQYAQIEALDGTINPLPAPGKAVAPVLSVNTGVNYYANRFFHLFVQARYNDGWFSDNYSVASLNEFRICFGLGFFIRLKKH